MCVGKHDVIYVQYIIWMGGYLKLRVMLQEEIAPLPSRTSSDTGLLYNLQSEIILL